MTESIDPTQPMERITADDLPDEDPAKELEGPGCVARIIWSILTFIVMGALCYWTVTTAHASLGLPLTDIFPFN